MTCECENAGKKATEMQWLFLEESNGDREAYTYEEAFEKMNIHKECCRKKIKNIFLLRQEKKELYNKINLLLVSKKARSAALLDFDGKQIRKAKKDYPDLIFTRDGGKYGLYKGKKIKLWGFFVSYKELPARKKGENDHIYTGRILGFQDPCDLDDIFKKSFKYTVSYYAIKENKKINFFNEGIRFKSRYKSNKEKFSKVLEPLGYIVEEIIEKKVY